MFEFTVMGARAKNILILRSSSGMEEKAMKPEEGADPALVFLRELLTSRSVCPPSEVALGAMRALSVGLLLLKPLLLKH